LDKPPEQLRRIKRFAPTSISQTSDVSKTSDVFTQ